MKSERSLEASSQAPKGTPSQDLNSTLVPSLDKKEITGGKRLCMGYIAHIIMISVVDTYVRPEVGF